MRFIFLLLCTVIPIAAQTSESYQYSKTSISEEARYEITQSTLSAKSTFKLDKFTGRVWQMVRSKEDRPAWEEVPVIKAPKIAPGSNARFQLFISGVAARFTYLLDTVSGQTWVFVDDLHGLRAWEPID